MNTVFEFSKLYHPPVREKRVYNNGKLEYLLEALHTGGTLASPEWRIRKYVYDVNNDLTDIVFANGNSDFVHVADSGGGTPEYTTYTYSLT